MIRLTADNIVDNWEMIKYAAVTVAFIDQKKIPQYTQNLLINLLKGDYQCWFYVADDKVVNVTITRIMKDIGDIPHLLIDSSYGFKAGNEEQKETFKETLLQFAKNVGCDRVIAYSANPMAQNAMKKMGMTEFAKIYYAKVGD